MDKNYRQKISLFKEHQILESFRDKISVLMDFLRIDNKIIEVKNNDNYSLFQLSDNHLVTEIIIIYNINIDIQSLTPNVFRAIFISPEIKTEDIDSFLLFFKSFLLVNSNDVEFLFEGVSLKDLFQYKIHYHFITGNNLKSSDYLLDDIDTFLQKVIKRKNKSISDYCSFDKIIDNLSSENHPRNNINHYQEKSIIEKINQPDTFAIIITGKSASGKTSLIFNICYSLIGRYECFYIESISINDKLLTDIATDLIKKMTAPIKKPILLVADDLQSNLDGAFKLINLLNYLQIQFGHSNRFAFVGIVWDDFVDEVKDKFINIPLNINILSDDLIESFIARSDRQLKEDEVLYIKRFAENNLFLLSTAINIISKDSTLSIESVLTKMPELIYRELYEKSKLLVSDSEIDNILFCLSLFGQYEIDLTSSFVQNMTNCSNQTILKLLNNNIVRQRGDYLTLGHKSYSRIIFVYLKNKTPITEWYKVNKNIYTNSDFILEFLKGLQPSLIYSILKKLYDNSETKKTSNTIINAWLSLSKILTKTLHQQKSDPTWNNTPSSVLFALQILDDFGYNKETESLISFFRNIYAYDSGKRKIDISIDQLSTVADFSKIKDCMIQEDEDNVKVKGEEGYKIKEQDFHKSWLMGIILSAEGTQTSLSNIQIEQLSICVENQIINDSYFYPERVSWCSSRVLIGLGLCGRNIHNSEAVKKVANWLLNHPNYDAEEGYWRSGTGSWNHWVEATALAISALVKVGIPHDNPKIEKGIKNLLNNKDLFITEGKELDGIFALQTLSQANVNLSKVYKETEYLANWMTNKADWESVKRTSRETFKQSCQIAQSAAGLLEVMWEMVQNDLPTVVKAIDHKEDMIRNISIFISYEWGAQKFAMELMRKLDEKYGSENILFDIKDNNDISSTQYMEKINDVDIVIYICTKAYKEKADARVKGVGYEAEHITKGISERKDKFIPILLEGSWRSSCMPNFWVNTIGIDCTNGVLTDNKFIELVDLIQKKHSKQII